MEADRFQANDSKSYHNNSDKDESSVVNEIGTSPSETSSDHSKENEHVDSQTTSTPAITNFSISEILKPSFGQQLNPGHELKLNDEKQAGKAKYGYGRNESLLFKFRYFKDTDICISSEDDNSHDLIDLRQKSGCETSENSKAVSPNKEDKQIVRPIPIQIYEGFRKDNGRRPEKSKSSFIDNFSAGNVTKNTTSRTMVMSSDAVKTSSTTVISPVAAESGRSPTPWPAWVYCTRYSDRPSSGPRSRKVTRRDKRPDEKRPRTAFTNDQLMRLRSEFETSRYLTEQRRRELAGTLGLSEAQIKIWYQNKRAKIKKATGGRMSTLAVHLMAQGLYNHRTGICETRRDC